MAEFESWSPWVEKPEKLHAPVEGEIKADIVIIGGGYTGLNTALNLRESGVDVALLEKDYCGAGASGRNAGHLTPTIGKDFPTLVQYFGKKKAVDYARFAERAVLQERRGSGTIASLLMSDHAEMQPVMTTEGKPLKEYVEAFERMLIDNAMRRHKGSIASVMDELCLPRRTLNEKMAKYTLVRGDYL